jgi:phosphatidylglycerophosphate synthase
MLWRVSEEAALQRVARATHGLLTPANLLDALAFVGAKWSGPRLDTWPGLMAGMASYVTDMADGKIARATRTSSHVGELVDHVGDKPKIGYALYWIWKKELADSRLIAAVATYNAVTASITIYDRLSRGTSQVVVGRSGKRAMFATATGIGLQTIATKVSQQHAGPGRVLRRGGAALAWSGLVVYGLPTIRGYWRMAHTEKFKSH